MTAPRPARASLLLAHDFPPVSGGIARALGEIARRAEWLTVLAGREELPDERDRPWPGRLVRSRVPTRRLRTLPGLLRWRAEAAALVRARDLTFAWAGNLKPAGHVAARLGVASGLILYGQDLARLEEQVTRSRWKRRAARFILGRAAGTLAISRWTAARFREVAAAAGVALAEDRVEVVPLGADPRRFAPDGPRYPLEPGVWLLTVARLVPHKGIDIALRVLAGLAPRHPGLRYAIAGTGPDRARLERQAEALGVAGRVRWLGRVPDVELPGLYRSAAVYLGLSREEGPEAEGFGLALAEAQGSGCAVVAGAGGGTADAVVDGSTGLLVPPGDAARAAAAVEALLDDPARRAALGAAGRLRVERYLNWDRVVRDLAAAEERFRGRTAG